MEKLKKRGMVVMGAFLVAAGAFGWNSDLGRQEKTLSLLEMKPGAEDHLHPSCDQVVFGLSKDPKAAGINVTIKPGKEAYPGIGILPTKSVWDLSKFGHVTVKLVNTGKEPETIAVRVDNDGDWRDNPWNSESLRLEPGNSQSIKVIFGYSFGEKKAFALKPEAVKQVLVFVVGSQASQSFRIESVEAGGPAGEQPPVAPEDVRVIPSYGLMVGTGIALDAGQITASNAQPSVADGMVRVSFPASKQDQSVGVKLPVGAWDLRQFLQVEVTLRNTGKEAILPRVRLRSKGGVSTWFSAKTPILATKTETIIVPFAESTVAVVGKPETGSHLTSDAVQSVEVAADGADIDRALIIESIKASAPEPAALPDWVGKKPPVPGDWHKTLSEEFDGTNLDSSVWTPYGENYYDKVSHWSKEDVILGGGVVKLRYEKKTGYQNDDTKRNQSPYAAGFLQSFDHWAQKYGYFESRMKLPKAPGLWPAFWMMPDRGRTDKPEHRGTTEDGGMEFDIMEQLTRWGPYRYNIALHYDGYEAKHKSVGSDKIYVQPDKDGFITCGLLWTPGSAVFYCNGKEVLRWDNPRISNVPAHFIFTLPSGGWDNNALEDSKLPSDFIIDYVRVWQRKDLASPNDGKMPPLAGAGKL